MKVISYSLFEAPCERFERRAYIRGFYWNFRMNKLVYPGWVTHLCVQSSIYMEYKELFEMLIEEGCKILTFIKQPELCEGMIMRMHPVWFEGVTHVICRDADAITTLRESEVVDSWLDIGGRPILSLHDNPAHSGLMGGMIGIWTDAFKEWYYDFGDFINGYNLSDRGSDQHLLNAKIGSVNVVEANLRDFEPNYKNPLWESELTCRHMGSAGVVEMEMLRFFQRHDPDNKKYFDIEKRFPDLFYWWI